MKLTRYALVMVALFIVILFIGGTPVSAAGENRLYFSERDNDLYYDSTLFDADRFMSHLSMIPGDVYRDELLIENDSALGYDLYFKVIPIQQSPESDKLLEHITMNLYRDGHLEYSGKVTGKDYSGDGVNLRDVIAMGHYSPGKQSKVTVDLHFSPSYEVTQEVFARVDWSFWGVGKDKEVMGVSPTPKPEHHLPGSLPKTGDSFEWVPVTIGLMCLLTGGVIALITVKQKRHQQ